jgi:hypothetical protein
MSPERRAKLATIVLVIICGVLAAAVLLNWLVEGGAALTHVPD